MRSSNVLSDNIEGDHCKQENIHMTLQELLAHFDNGGIFGDDPEAVRRWSEQIEYNEDNVVKVVEA